MRYTPAALALSLLAGLTASVGWSAPPQTIDPRAATLQAQGRAEVAAGRYDAAVDAYEAALAIQPGSVVLYNDLADATRRMGLQGKALHYYRAALALDPQNQIAIAGEGVAFVEKGALEKARRNLTRLQQLCGGDCAPSRDLAAAIAKGPAQRVVTAEQVKAQPVVTQN